MTEIGEQIDKQFEVKVPGVLVNPLDRFQYATFLALHRFVEDRRERNPRVREILATASDAVIGYVAADVGGELAYKEMNIRLQERTGVPLDPIFRIINGMCVRGIGTKAQKTTLESYMGYMCKYVPQADLDELAAIFAEYTQSVVERDTDCLDVILANTTQQESLLDLSVETYRRRQHRLYGGAIDNDSPAVRDFKFRLNNCRERSEKIKRPLAN